MLPLDHTLPIAPSPIPLLRFTDLPHPERAVAGGRAVRVRHGVYADAMLWQALAPWDRYLSRVHAVALLHPDVAFCLESAAALLGMPTFGEPREIHVLVPATSASRSVSGVRTHRCLPERSMRESAGLLFTSPGDTAIDLARHRQTALALAIADAALRLDPRLTTAHLATINESRSSSRGRQAARWPLANATAQAESPLESISRAVIEWLGFEPPALQVEIGAPEADRVDFCWPTVSAAGEADGDVKYDGRFGDPLDAMHRRAARDRRLRRHLRTVVHWSWTDVVAPASLRSILLGSGLRPTRLADAAKLHSLARTLSSGTPRPRP